MRHRCTNDALGSGQPLDDATTFDQQEATRYGQNSPQKPLAWWDVAAISRLLGDISVLAEGVGETKKLEDDERCRSFAPYLENGSRLSHQLPSAMPTAVFGHVCNHAWSLPLPPQVLNPAKPRQFWSTDQHRDTFEPMLRFRRYTSSRLIPVTHSLLLNLPERMSGWSIFRKLYRKKRKASAIEISEPCDVISSIRMAPIAVPESQTVLLLREPRQPYELVKHYPTPELHTGSEVLVKTRAIGLNPIDWKAP